jgi:hypothetical protein
MALWSNTDADASKPKYLNTADKNATLGVSIDEAQEPSNRVKGIDTPGWVKYTTYTDAQNNIRNKSEVLVAMGSITGDNDTIDPDPVITILTQPENTSVIANVDDAIFTVSASATRNAIVTYQWQSVDSASVGVVPLPFVNVSGATSPTLNAGKFGIGDNGTLFRVIVSAVGATPVTSNTVTLTVTAE